jgi:hypothetical protein
MALLAAAFAMCKAGKLATTVLSIPVGSLPCITAIVVALATLLAPLAHRQPPGAASRAHGRHSDAGS